MHASFLCCDNALTPIHHQLVLQGKIKVLDLHQGNISHTHEMLFADIRCWRLFPVVLRIQQTRGALGWG